MCKGPVAGAGLPGVSNCREALLSSRKPSVRVRTHPPPSRFIRDQPAVPAALARPPAVGFWARTAFAGPRSLERGHAAEQGCWDARPFLPRDALPSRGQMTPTGLPSALCDSLTSPGLTWPAAKGSKFIAHRFCEGGGRFPHFPNVETNRLREVQSLARSHTAVMQWGWNLNVESPCLSSLGLAVSGKSAGG